MVGGSSPSGPIKAYCNCNRFFFFTVYRTPLASLFHFYCFIARHSHHCFEIDARVCAFTLTASRLTYSKQQKDKGFLGGLRGLALCFAWALFRFNLTSLSWYFYGQKGFKALIFSLTILGGAYLANSSFGIYFTTSEKAKLSELLYHFKHFTKIQCEFYKEHGDFGTTTQINFKSRSNNLFKYQSNKPGLLKATITQETNSCKQNEYFTIETTKEYKHKIKTSSNPDCLETLSEISGLFRFEPQHRNNVKISI